MKVMKKLGIFIMTVAFFLLLYACNRNDSFFKNLNTGKIKIYGVQVDENYRIIGQTVTEYDNEADLKKDFDLCKNAKSSPAKSKLSKTLNPNYIPRNSSTSRDGGGYDPCPTNSPTGDPAYNYLDHSTFNDVGGMAASIGVDFDYNTEGGTHFVGSISVGMFGSNAPQTINTTTNYSTTTNSVTVSGTIYATWTSSSTVSASGTGSVGASIGLSSTSGSFSGSATLGGSSTSNQNVTHRYNFRVTRDVCTGRTTMALSIDGGPTSYTNLGG
jgi:hypothetical protein